eukprot:827295-Prorocentrum_minimum.AAC.1
MHTNKFSPTRSTADTKHARALTLYPGITVSRYHGITVSRYHGITVSRYHGIPVSRYHGITGIRPTPSAYNVSLYHCITASLLSLYHKGHTADTKLVHCVTVSRYHGITVSLCAPARAPAAPRWPPPPPL